MADPVEDEVVGARHVLAERPELDGLPPDASPRRRARSLIAWRGPRGTSAPCRTGSRSLAAHGSLHVLVRPSRDRKDAPVEPQSPGGDRHRGMKREHHCWESPPWAGRWSFSGSGTGAARSSCSPPRWAPLYQNEDFGLIGGARRQDRRRRGPGLLRRRRRQGELVQPGRAPGLAGPPPRRVRRATSRRGDPLIRHASEREDVVTFGASFGAYHAMNFAGRFPELVTRRPASPALRHPPLP